MLTGLVSVSTENIEVLEMGVVNMAKDIKKVHPEELVCYKVGAFVQTFGKDAYILSYLFGYKLYTVFYFFSNLYIFLEKPLTK